MNSIDEILPLMEYLIHGLAKHFGSKCEFVVHDYSKEFTASIVAIENGHVTGRSVGKGGTKVGLEIIQGSQEEDGRYAYTMQTHDGKRMRSSTIYLKRDDGTVLGTLCINNDITDYVNARNALNQLIGDTPAEQNGTGTVVFPNVEDMLIAMIKDSLDAIGTPVPLMTREQKIEGIRYLHSRGVFKIKNAANIVAKFYDVSRYTVYNYINDD